MSDLEAALETTSPDLLAYFRRRLDYADAAADLLAETMLVAWRRRSRFPADCEGQRMWLFGVAAKVLANHRRGVRRRLALAARLRDLLYETPAPDHSESQAIRDAVARLPEPQRELVMLVHWEGFSLVEAAVLLELNASTARGRYAAARETLRHQLVPIG